ncbi:MAG: beta-lactamase family protein [Armatimonadetes bacterium]|nr:beta-lactamase family protein [Armatimonadota bacterium]
MSISRRDLMAGCLGAGLFSAVAFGDESLDAKVKALGEKYFDLYGAPGLLVIAVKGGKPVTTLALGFRDIVQPNDITIKDRIAVGSLSKPICGYVVSRLVQDKVLSWETPFSKLAGDLCRDLHSPAANATLGQLMSHTAGLTYNVPGQDQVTGVVPTEGREYLARLELSATGITAPGQRMEYAGGANLAVVMAERATEKSYEELIAQYINEELKLPSIQMGMDILDKNVGSTPRGHYIDGKTHEFLTYGRYTLWGRSMRYMCDATLAITGAANEIASLLAVAAGFGGPSASATFESARNTNKDFPKYTLGSWAKNDKGLYHFGSSNLGDWSSVYALDSSKTTVFVYMNCNTMDNSFKGDAFVNELNALFTKG